MVEQGYNYLDSSIQQMTEFFETRIGNLEKFDSKKDSIRNQDKQSNKKTRRGNIPATVFLKTGTPKVLKLVNFFDSIMVHVGTPAMNVH